MRENEDGEGKKLGEREVGSCFILFFPWRGSHPPLCSSTIQSMMITATVLFHTFQTVPNCSLKFPVAGQCWRRPAGPSEASYPALRIWLANL